ncbi:MAG: hypothetical protein Q4C75_02680, partial [Bergeyella zoohelcum]|nr:hypothetical protein [Bergeyella zoohelcum]
MKINIFNRKTLLAFGVAAMTLTACNNSDDRVEESVVNPDSNKEFQLAFASGSGSISGTYMQGVSDVSTGTISYDGKGSLISTGRTSRIFHTDNGKYLYSLTYQAGTVDKFEFKGGSTYEKLPVTLDGTVLLGARGIRFYKLSETEGSLHYITSKAKYEADGTTYKHHEMALTIGILDFASMTIKDGYQKAVPFTLPETLASQGYHITRIDCPVLSNGKLYYGAALSKFNATTGKNEATVDKAMTLVVDYPSLKNPTVVETTLAVGSTNGYRTPTQQVNEQGEILQMINGGGKTSIVKLVNGQYHSTFKFSLDEALGRPGKTSSNGFFYVGNGIAYMPYEKRHLPQIQIGVDPQGNPSYSSAWGLARIDLNNKTVVDLDVPDGLWLTQWQNSVVRNGKFYIALAPVGQQGYIYSFDINSTSPTGTKGATTISGADQYF